MRKRGVVFGSFVIAAALTLGCSGDPNDPRTWAKKLKDVREQKEAFDRIAAMDADKARVVVPELIELYQETRSPDHLQALVRYKDERAKPVFVEALDYSNQKFDTAIIAAGFLGDMKATDAVDKLIQAAEKTLPVGSPANGARLAAIRALVKIGDPRAVGTLTKILTTSADEQDFLLNQKAALGLAELHDPASVPALIKGLFMTGRQTDIFQECRLALVRVGAPAIPAVMELFQDKNLEIRAMAKEQAFIPGVVPMKAAILLGDLRAREAVPLLLGKLRASEQGKEHAAIVISLGQIGTPAAVDALIAVAKDAKARPMLRASATDAIYLSGDRRAVPVLLDIAKSGDVVVNGQKAPDLRANAAIDLARIAGPEHFAAFKALADKETAAQGEFGEALDRMHVAQECGAKIECYGKYLADPSVPRAEKAAFALGFSGDRAAIPLLLGAFKPIASVPQHRYAFHQALLFAITRLADRDCKECLEKLKKQIEQDEKAVRLPGVPGMLGETRVALAVISSTAPGSRERPPAASEAAATDDDAKPANSGKAGKAGAAGKAGKPTKKVASRGGKRR